MDQNRSETHPEPKTYSFKTLSCDEVSIHVKQSSLVVQVVSQAITGAGALLSYMTTVVCLNDIKRIGLIAEKPEWKTFIISTSHDESIIPIIRIKGILHKDVTLIAEEMIDHILSLI